MIKTGELYAKRLEAEIERLRAALECAPERTHQAFYAVYMHWWEVERACALGLTDEHPLIDDATAP